MPNHLHFIAQCLPDHPLADVLRDFKKHMAKQIIRQYQAESNQKVLAFLAEAVPRPQKQRYKVWDDDYDAKEAFTPEFLKQKMDYIHNNPLQPHWCLAERAEEYPWSSARFYLYG
jgi:REP element-mobilizing transposase RayT